MEAKQVPAKIPESEEEQEKVIKLLKERIEAHDNNKKSAQDKLHEICERLRAQIIELEDRISKELEEKFILEDNRLQAALNELRGNRTVSALQKAKAELLVEQSYKIIEDNFDSKLDLTTLYELKAERRIAPELMEMRKPTNVRVTGANRGRVSVQFAFLNFDEERVLSDNTIVNPIKYKCMLFKKGNEQENKKEYFLDKDEGNNPFFTPDILEAETTYGIRVKMVFGGDEREWSDEIAEFTTPEFKDWCAWEERPDDVGEERKYSVYGRNPRIATKANSSDDCIIIGNTRIPLDTVTSWSIKVLNSKNNNGFEIFIGVAPSDIKQNVYSYNHYNGWYFGCYHSTLCSGPPHYYRLKEYGPRKENGRYVHTGDSVGIVMDTTKGELSFVLNNVNLGVAFEGIPLDKPLVPCVILGHNCDSVELII